MKVLSKVSLIYPFASLAVVFADGKNRGHKMVSSAAGLSRARPQFVPSVDATRETKNEATFYFLPCLVVSCGGKWGLRETMKCSTLCRITFHKQSGRTDFGAHRSGGKIQ